MLLSEPCCCILYRSGRDKLTNVSPTSDTPTPGLQVTVTNIAVSAC